MGNDKDCEVGRVRSVSLAGVEYIIEALDELDAVAACPHFGVMWPSAVGLCEHLTAKLPHVTYPYDVLELGCGLALPSLVARRLGARSVVATDRHAAVMRLLTRNVQNNGLDGIEYRNLDWRRGTNEGQPTGLGKYDFVFGSDLLYEPWQPGALASVLPLLLKETGEAWIADPGRRYLDEFVRILEAAGFRCELDAIRTIKQGSGTVDILLLSVRR